LIDKLTVLLYYSVLLCRIEAETDGILLPMGLRTILKIAVQLMSLVFLRILLLKFMNIYIATANRADFHFFDVETASKCWSQTKRGKAPGPGVDAIEA
jgi:hypothetical protein